MASKMSYINVQFGSFKKKFDKKEPGSLEKV